MPHVKESQIYCEINPIDYSQWGEQQLIAHFLAKLPAHDKWCVDVGAGDGETLSNTRELRTAGYKAVLIEADSAKWRAIQNNPGPYPRTILCSVMSSGCHSLDRILTETRNTPPPTDFDFLSIDIDGNDYHIWAGLKNYTPKLVCIEFNPTIQDNLTVIPPDNPDLRMGSSLAALVELGKTKGYELAAVTVTNAIFVRADLYPLLGITDNSIPALWTNRCFLSWTFYGYDGAQYTAGYPVCPWAVNADEVAANV